MVKMKWFRHYTNASKGESIQRLMGHFDKARAYGLYFLFTEYFADKWDGCSEPFFIVFKNELSSFLGLKQNKLDSFLKCFENETKMNWKQNGNLLEIYFPKLQEILDKNALPESGRRALRALNPSGEEKRREENIQKGEKICEIARQENEDWFASAKEKYKTFFPKTTPGPKAKERFFEQIKTVEEFEKLNISLANYSEFLKTNPWRNPKQTFETFLGTKKSGYFWRDFIDFSNEQKVEKGVWLK